MANSNYFVIVKSGPTILFEGPSSLLKERFYKYPDDWSEDDIVEHTKQLASDMNWYFESYLVH